MLQRISHRLSVLASKTTQQTLNIARLSISRDSVSSSTKQIYFGHITQPFMKFIRVVYDTMKRDGHILIRIPKSVHVETLVNSLNTHYNRHPNRKEYDIQVTDGRLSIRPCTFITWSQALDIEEFLHVPYSETNSVMQLDFEEQSSIGDLIHYIGSYGV